MMKLKLNPCVLLFFYVSLITLAGHYLEVKQGDQEMNLPLSDVSAGISPPAVDHHMMNENNLINPFTNHLMEGIIMDQECENDDEECLMKRRSIYEAHLDYIYTQHHNP
ncbi:uncharacterized protein LOC124922755 [Impatiens glandulifera]|uniref:uncharacterized protein LOC124922755 n=1 Tax=Impatiens glandulifera TaxID=253017 RepID=UPI001FB16F05|nr:uncharacterized protein LOC124922755 [Impatiens glandulifera]